MRAQRLDLMLYIEALPVYARNVGVLLPLLVASAIGLGLQYLEAPLFSPVGGAADPLMGFVIQVIAGFGFAVAVIFADDAWRHNRADLSAAWSTARRKIGEILLVVIGFFFLVYVAQIVGSTIGGTLGIPYVGLVLPALALWAFIYSVPAVAMGGIPAGGAFSASLQTAKRHALATAILAAVSFAVYYGVAVMIPAQFGISLGAGYDIAQLLLTAIALGYVALVIARQYADFAFRTPW